MFCSCWFPGAFEVPAVCISAFSLSTNRSATPRRFLLSFFPPTPTMEKLSCHFIMETLTLERIHLRWDFPRAMCVGYEGLHAQSQPGFPLQHNSTSELSGSWGSVLRGNVHDCQNQLLQQSYPCCLCMKAFGTWLQAFFFHSCWQAPVSHKDLARGCEFPCRGSLGQSVYFPCCSNASAKPWWERGMK